MPSLEFNCEGLLMALLAPEQATGGRLVGVPFVHHDLNTAAALDRLIFRAEAGEHEPEGPQCRPVNVEITYASGTATPEVADQIADAVQEQIYDPPNWPTLDFPTDFPEIAIITIENGTECTREDGDKQRRRTVTIPLKGKLQGASRLTTEAGEHITTEGGEHIAA